MVAQEDSELIGWLRTAAGLTAQPPGGSFVRTIADAAMRADYGNYAILRPALLQLKAKYPQYAPKEDVPE